jgi:hypothetical protein
LRADHNHLALIGASPGYWRQVVFPFLAQGLAGRELCLYLTTLHTPAMITALLASEGVDVAQAREAGQFAIRDAAQAYIPRGWFDPDRVIKRFAGFIYQAVGDGFAGVRVVADMAWIAYRPPGGERLEEYERRVENELFELYPLKAICFYDSRFLDGGLLSQARRTHRVVLSEGIPASEAASGRLASVQSLG